MIIGLNFPTGEGYGQKLAVGLMHYANRNESVKIHLPYSSVRSMPISPEKCDGIVGVFHDWGMPGIKAGIPAVNVRAYAVAGLPHVTYDQKELIDMAMRHLIERGIRHFAYVTYGDKLLTEMRRGFLKLHPMIQPGNFTVLYQRKYFGNAECVILDELRALPKPAGIFVDGDSQGAHLLRACRKNGIKVPEELTVVSVNNFTNVCMTAEPTLTSIDVNIERIGFEAARLLAAASNGEPMPEAPVLVKGKSLVPRGSSDYWAPRDHHVDRALSYMMEHIEEPLTLEDLAVELGITKRVFERRFNKVMDCSPIKYLNDMRFKQAQALLKASAMTLGEVARACGYDNDNYLCFIFRKRLGITPTAYRKSPEPAPKG